MTVLGVPGIPPGHPFGTPGSHFRSTGGPQDLLGASGSPREALWGALGSPGGSFWERFSPLANTLGPIWGNFLESFMPWSGFERRIVHTFLKIRPGRPQRLSGTFEFARKKLLFFEKHIFKRVEAHSIHIPAARLSRGKHLVPSSLFFGVGGSGRRPLESADPQGRRAGRLSGAPCQNCAEWKLRKLY